MMSPTREQVIEKARRLFPDVLLDDVLAVLDGYGGEPYQQEKERVQMAALKISEGDLDRLRDAVATARTDFRDVLLAAEYPREGVVGLAGPASEDDFARAREEDARRYREWRDGEDAAAGVLTCERCGGAGVVPPDGALVRVEEGRLIRNDAPWTTCPVCRGTGRRDAPQGAAG
jgi:hypothetical protein